MITFRVIFSRQICKNKTNTQMNSTEMVTLSRAE